MGSVWLDAPWLNFFSKSGLGQTSSAKESHPRSRISQRTSAGEPRAAIVVGDGPFYRFVVGELQGYFQKLSGAKLPVIYPPQAGRQPAGWSCGLVGGGEANELVDALAARKLVNFEGLKEDGFVLRTVQTDKRTLLVIAGEDEPSTMYAAYDLLERCGVVFLLNGDFLPEPRPDLTLLSWMWGVKRPLRGAAFHIKCPPKPEHLAHAS
ncbi:MAG TPA: alpha-glucuronidase family glycosyl hydrolase [Terriglobia bacterium]|nr:alpha-glucuronidase family glycosyl hydrolase [Terriglobia bacterium]